MPLARDDRIRLARVLSWSRRNGWTHDTCPNTFRTFDGHRHVSFDSAGGQLVVDRMTHDPLRCRVAIVPVDTLDETLRVLAALGHIPWWYADDRHADSPETDDDTRALYRALMDGDRHAYISTYCQHGLHDDCRLTCKCCDAPCLCSGCLHVPPVPVVAQCLRSYGYETHPGHRWQRDDEQVQCLGWPLPGDVDEFDGPHSFADAGQAFADRVDGRISAERAAEALSHLAHHGLIISTAYHDEVTGGGPADVLDDTMADVADIFRTEP